MSERATNKHTNEESERRKKVLINLQKTEAREQEAGKLLEPLQALMKIIKQFSLSQKIKTLFFLLLVSSPLRLV
jgi:hypothetical protein